MDAPTLKLHIARCLDKLDRMLEAAEVYRAVIATELEADAPKVHRKARKSAVPELAKVLDATPTVSVVVKGRDGASAELTIDGEIVALSEIGERKSLDPGHYRFQATVGERLVTRELDLERGQSERVVLYLDGADSDGDPQPAQEDSLAWSIGGWGAVAVGVAGVDGGEHPGNPGARRRVRSRSTLPGSKVPDLRARRREQF